jgi:purine-binding chemotaxis protein CheW
MNPRSPLAQGEQTWLEVARGAARGRPASELAPNGQRLLVFALDGAPYALPVERIREIVRQRPITPLPRLPAEVLGVISLRGQIIQVIDPRPRLALPAASPGARSRIVVAHDGEGRVAGILVDSVEEVVTVSEDGMRDARGGQGSAVEALYRHQGRFVSIVDLDRVMDVDAGA